MSRVLAVDLGKTGCRVALYSDGHTQPDATASGPGAGGLATRDGLAAALAAVGPPAREVLASVVPDTVAVGAAGAAADPEAAALLAAELGRQLGGDEIVVTSDAVTSHAGALAGAPGVVLAAGTGAVAIAVGVDGASFRVNGWGPLLGDQGGGAFIGLCGLRAALRAFDGRGPSTTLVDDAIIRFGGDLARLPGIVGASANPAREAAAFAPDVARAARAGDVVARRVLAQAADALAETVVAAARHLVDAHGSGTAVPTALTGGALELAGLAELVRERLSRAAVPLEFRTPAGGPLDGARLVAEQRDTVHEASLVRHRRLQAAR